VTWETIEANAPINNARFYKPSAAGKAPEDRQGQPADASQQQPKPEEKKQEPPKEQKPPKGEVKR